MNYIASYIREHDFTKTRVYTMLDYPKGLTWRELQERFDPGYHHNYLKFYNLGSEIVLKAGG